MSPTERLLRRLLPKSLFARSLLIVVTPVMLLQLVLSVVFFERHWDTVTRRLALGLAGDIAIVIQLQRNAPDAAAQSQLLGLARGYLDLDISLMPGAILPASTDRNGSVFSIVDRTLAQALNERLFRPFTIDTRGFDRDVEIRVQLQDGVLRVLTPRKRLDSTTTTIFVLWMLGASLILLGIAVIFLRNQMRPIIRLADAADRLGKGRPVGNLRIGGATEIRQAALAFLAMRDRIERQISQRTEMLAGVSHDLRTPLTRMKLELALLGDHPAAKTLDGDVREMEVMIEAYLAFARGQDAEPPVQSDLSAILADVVEDARRQGRDVALKTPGSLLLPLRPNAIKRCITNLVDNALRHASRGSATAPVHVEISASRNGEMVEIAIDDSGPGIPASQRDDAFKPFNRLDESRNPTVPGTGLGLTIARDIARGHGGDLVLDDAPAGGLRALIRLPM